MHWRGYRLASSEAAGDGIDIIRELVGKRMYGSS
jgi:hypothetical protein